MIAADVARAADQQFADLARIEALWAFARGRFGDGGPWLFGRYSAADAFFAPVAAHLAAGVPVELHNYPGTVHGFDLLAPLSDISTRAVNEGIEAFKRAMAR